MAGASSAGQRVASSWALGISLAYYFEEMARGFESKDVEFQQAEAERTKRLGPTRSPEERAADARRRTLELSLARARADLINARSPAHREMLEQAIKALEDQLALS